MDAFFGGGAAGGRGRGPRSRVQPGADALIRMQLTLEECATGVTRDLAVDTAVLCSECTGSGAAPRQPARPCCDICGGRGEVQSVQRSFLGQVVTSRPCPNCRGFGEVIPDPCRQCGGDGRVRSRRTVGVRIPAGVADGMRVRLAGQGEVGPGGGPAGDLYVEVDELPHEVFTRDGADLHCTVQLPMTAAALGTTLELPTLDGHRGAAHRARHADRHRAHAARQGHAAAALHRPGRRPRRPHGARRRRRPDAAGRASRPTCCASSPRCAARSSRTWRRRAHEGLFSRLRDSFGGR